MVTVFIEHLCFAAVYGVFRRGGSLCERESPLRDPKRTQGAIRPLTPELPVLNYFLGTVWRCFSSERFGVLLFPLSRCCGECRLLFGLLTECVAGFDARDTLGVLLAVEDAGVVEDLQALETALAAVDAGGVDAQGVRLLAARLRPSLLAVAALGGVLTRLLRFDIAPARAARTLLRALTALLSLSDTSPPAADWRSLSAHSSAVGPTFCVRFFLPSPSLFAASLPKTMTAATIIIKKSILLSSLQVA